MTTLPLSNVKLQITLDMWEKTSSQMLTSRFVHTFMHSHSYKRTTRTLQTPFSLPPLNLYLLPSHSLPAKAKITRLLPVSKSDAPSTFPSILFVHTWRITDSPMLQQMGTLYTLELSTNSGPNECRSTEATLTQQWNVAIVCSEAKRNRVLCLNPISSVSFHFYIRRGLKDQWSRYRFPRPIFQLTLSASPPSAPSFRSFFTICIFSSLILHLHSCHIIFAPSLLFLSLSLSFRLGMYDSPYIGIGGGERLFQIPSASISQDSWGALIQSLPAGEVDSDI